MSVPWNIMQLLKMKQVVCGKPRSPQSALTSKASGRNFYTKCPNFHGEKEERETGWGGWWGGVRGSLRHRGKCWEQDQSPIKFTSGGEGAEEGCNSELFHFLGNTYL